MVSSSRLGLNTATLLLPLHYISIHNCSWTFNIMAPHSRNHPKKRKRLYKCCRLSCPLTFILLETASLHQHCGFLPSIKLAYWLDMAAFLSCLWKGYPYKKCREPPWGMTFDLIISSIVWQQSLTLTGVDIRWFCSQEWLNCSPKMVQVSHVSRVSKS